MPTKSITGGNFQDELGNLVTGNLLLVLSQDAQLSGSSGQVAPKAVRIAVTAGAIPSTPIWFNDQLSPGGTFYVATVFDAPGNKIYGPENWSLIGASGLDVGTIIPVASSPTVSFPLPVLQNPGSPQTITGQSLTLTSSAPFITQGPGTHSGTETFTGPININTVSSSNVLIGGQNYYSSLLMKDSPVGLSSSTFVTEVALAGTVSSNSVANPEIDGLLVIPTIVRGSSGTHTDLHSLAVAAPSDGGGSATSNGNVSTFKVEANAPAGWCSSCIGGQSYGSILGGDTLFKGKINLLNSGTGINQLAGELALDFGASGTLAVRSAGGARLTISTVGQVNINNSLRIGDFLTPQEVLQVNGNIRTEGAFYGVETSAPSVAAGRDYLWADSTAHRLKMNNNSVGAKTIAALESDTFTSPTISLLTNGTGLQLFNTTTTCTTGAAVGATCTTANITLPVAEADTSYRVTCTGKGLTNVPVVIATTNSSASQFTITIAALTAAAASFASYDCVAGHN